MNNQYRFNETIEDALWQFVQNTSGITTIWDKQDVYGVNKAKRPVPPFVTLNIISGPIPIGYADFIYKSGDKYTMRIRKKFTLSVNVYTLNNHMGISTSIWTALQDENVLIGLRTHGLSYLPTKEGVRDISQLLETGHELRANIDLVFSYCEVTEVEPGYVKKITIEKTNDPKFKQDIIP
jgi:hypothetical protein